MVRKAAVFSVFVIAVLVTAPSQAGVSFAGRVVSYDAGSGYLSGYFGDYTNANAALGPVARDTGEWEGVKYYTTPFNMPYTPADAVSIGAGGHLTLELQNYITPGDGLELGVFSYQQFLYEGATGSPVTLQRASQSAIVEVSEDGSTWYALNGGAEIEMNTPGIGYSDEAGTIESDFGRAFAGGLSDFDGLATIQDVLDVFNGSAGGNWLDVSSSGLDRIGYVRFSVLEGNAFDLEAVSIASGAIGAPIPEPASLLLIAGGAVLVRRRKVRS